MLRNSAALAGALAITVFAFSSGSGRPAAQAGTVDPEQVATDLFEAAAQADGEAASSHGDATLVSIAS